MSVKNAVARAIKKIRATAIPGIEEVNLFKEDGKVIQFINPLLQTSISCNTYIVDGPSDTKPSRLRQLAQTEEKCRKTMQKLDMRPIPGVVRMSVKKSNQVLFVITNPDVFKSPYLDTYVVFGSSEQI